VIRLGSAPGISGREIRSIESEPIAQSRKIQTMFTTIKLALLVAIVLGIASAAQAATKHQIHRHDGPAVERPSGIYATFSRCSPSKRIDLSRLQPGEMAIMIQSRGYRESEGTPVTEGECW
jgi:hypothetical protein